MKNFILFLIVMLIAGCSKKSEIITPEPEPVANDSAKIIYVRARDNSGPEHTIYAFDEAGNIKWQKNLSAPNMFPRPVYVNNDIFISSSGTLYYLNANTGTEKWIFPIGDLTDVQVKNDTVVVGNRGSGIYLLDKNTRNVLWTKTLAGFGRMPVKPLLYNDKIFCVRDVAGIGYNITAYDLATKNLIWEKHFEFPTAASDLFIHNGKLVFGSPYKAIYVINPANGDMIWNKKFDSPVKFFVQDNRFIYMDRYSADLFKINADNGDTVFVGGGGSRQLPDNGQDYVYKDSIYIYSRVPFGSQSVLHSYSMVNGKSGVSRYKPYALYNNIVVVGKTIYASRQLQTIQGASQIVILNASGFTLKDSISLPHFEIDDVSVLSHREIMYSQ